jgi:hypothetical protein
MCRVGESESRRRRSGALVPPETLEPIRRQRRIPRRILDIAMPQVSLERPCIASVIGKLVAAGVAQHVSVRRYQRRASHG